MQLGIDQFLKNDVSKYKGKKIGLITNTTGVNKKLIPTIDLFYEHPDIHLVALFAPEHGIRGDVKEGAEIDFFIDEKTTLPVYSLYGETKKPSSHMLKNIDVLFFDLQDIGSRYYTYIYTLALAMKACEEMDIECVVLDRPNPISGKHMDGNIVEENVRSFVGMLPLPNRHSMTVGELASLFKYEFNYNCSLTIIAMEGWARHMYFDDTSLLWVPPSPNTTTIDMCLLYAGTCLFEGTNVSEGRGTTQPFECIGSPFIDGQKLAKQFNSLQLAGVIARPITFIPYYQKYKGQLCSGVQLHITNRVTIRPLYVGLHLLQLIIKKYPYHFEFIKNDQKKYFFDLLAGTKQLRQLLFQDQLSLFFEQSEQQVESFKMIATRHQLYN